jgi:hypothetical protein
MITKKDLQARYRALQREGRKFRRNVRNVFTNEQAKELSKLAQDDFEIRDKLEQLKVDIEKIIND